MSRCWDYDDYDDKYNDFRLKEAEVAMNDREVGLIGMAEAANEAKKLRRKLGIPEK